MSMLVQRMRRSPFLAAVVGCILLTGTVNALAATSLVTVIVEANHPVLEREMTSLLKSLGSKVVSSRQEATLLLRASSKTEKTSAGFEVNVAVDLVERGRRVVVAWRNDPTFARANRDDRESIDDLVETALLVGKTELRQRIKSALARLTKTGVIYRINIHRDNAVDPVRLKSSLAQRPLWKLLGIDSNAYGLIIRVRYPGNPAILLRELADILKGVAGADARIGKIEMAPRQVITVRCVSGHGNDC
jgi:hypothetical protein